MEATHPPLVRTRLSILMFLQFFIWGGWGFALAGYVTRELNFTGKQLGLLMAIPAIGALISPLCMGLIADRLFAAQRLLCVLHLIGGACLIAAAQQTTFPMLMTCMVINGLAFMPTLALANSVAFRHIPDPDKFPRIAVLGTVGWIVAVLVADAFLGGISKPYFLYLSGGGAITLGLYCLTLPHTPPKGGGDGGGDAFGMHALKMLKEPSFLIFITCVTLVVIPACGYFFSLATPMLGQRGYPSPLALTSLNQFAEIIFMFSMPWFVAKFGLKRVLTIGMAAWGIRYLCFAVPRFDMAIIGLILHGFCYSFLYVGAYMYVDKRAPDDLKASAQSLLAFLLLGVGWFVGAYGAGIMTEIYPAPLADVKEYQTSTATMGVLLKDKEDKRALPRWDDPKTANSAWRFLDLPGTVKTLMGDEIEAKPDFAQQVDADKDGQVTLAEIEAIPDAGITVDGTAYSRHDMVVAFNSIAQLEVKDGQTPEALTREQWLAAQMFDWKPIWTYPAIAILIVTVFFFFAMPDMKEKEAAGGDE